MLVSFAYTSSAIYSAQGTSKLSKLRCPLHSSSKPSPEMPTASPLDLSFRAGVQTVSPSQPVAPWHRPQAAGLPGLSCLPLQSSAQTAHRVQSGAGRGAYEWWPMKTSTSHNLRIRDLVLEKISSQSHPAGNMPRRAQKVGGSEKWCVMTPEGSFQVRLDNHAR